MLGIRMLVTDPERRAALEKVIQIDPELVITGVGTTVTEACRLLGEAAYSDVILIDLAHPAAATAHFWAEIHVIFPWARLVAITATPINAKVLQAALQAGTYYMVEWSDTADRLLRAIWAAGLGEGFIPLGSVLSAMTAFFDGQKIARGWVRIGEAYFDLFRRQIRRSQHVTNLTRREFELLVFLVGHAGCVYTPDQLQQQAWGTRPRARPPNQAVRSVVKRLRRKLELDPARPRCLLSSHGHGYVVPEEVIGG